MVADVSFQHCKLDQTSLILMYKAGAHLTGKKHWDWLSYTIVGHLIHKLLVVLCLILAE